VATSIKTAKLAPILACNEIKQQVQKIKLFSVLEENHTVKDTKLKTARQVSFPHDKAKTFHAYMQ